MLSHLFATSKASRLRSRRTSPRLRPLVESLEPRCVLATAYLATDLVSDQPGIAPVTDPNLVNAWGIAVNPTGAFWVSSNGADMSTLYTGDVAGSPLIKNPLEVTIPGGEPTGQVFNNTMSDFVIPTTTAKAIFIFASQSGMVTAWSPAAPPVTTAKPAFTTTDDAIYTGIALGNNGTGNFLYLADFHNAEIDVLNSSFAEVSLAGSFTDPTLPAGFAPFNVAAIGGKLYVAYAKQDADAEDEVAGAGLGFVSVFDTNGNFLQRLVSQGKLNAPWAMVQAPASFGDFSGDLLVGNFGNGRINAYDPTTGAFQGTLSQSPGHPLQIDGLWGLAVGNGIAAGDTNTIYYAAGPDDETHGLFGKITANPAGTNPVQAELVGGVLMITGSRNDDHVEVKLKKKSDEIVVQAGHQVIGTFDAADVDQIQFQGFAGDDHIRIHNHITIPAILDGGADDDFLAGSQGSNILLGGSGNDHLMAEGGNDLLIGGDGRDHLMGQKGDDLLIGGSTAHDTHLELLMQILAELNSADDYATRVAKLRAGTGVPKLDATTVIDDGDRDILHGGPGLDWFLAGPDDHLPGRLSSEQVN
jgi:TIGR03118 family protein